MGTHADYVAAVAQSCTSMYTRLATHRPVVALRTHLQPRFRYVYGGVVERAYQRRMKEIMCFGSKFNVVNV